MEGSSNPVGCGRPLSECPCTRSGGCGRSSWRAPLLGRAACGPLCRDAPALEQHGCPLELIGGNQSPRRTKDPLNTAWVLTVGSPLAACQSIYLTTNIRLKNVDFSCKSDPALVVCAPLTVLFLQQDTKSQPRDVQHVTVLNTVGSLTQRYCNIIGHRRIWGPSYMRSVVMRCIPVCAYRPWSIPPNSLQSILWRHTLHHFPRGCRSSKQHVRRRALWRIHWGKHL
jgi:hypothetical protein